MIDSDRWVGTNLGQCRIKFNTSKTKKFYSALPLISENCSCGDCVYFEKVVAKKDIRLFSVLRIGNVDSSRQPNINPEGVCSIGETDKFKRSYLGYYKVFGVIRKTQNSTAVKDDDGNVLPLNFSGARMILTLI